MVSPLFGVIAAVAAATGEIRYRLPWDGMFIVLAVEFYRRLRVPLREVAPGGAPSGVVPADEMLAAERAARSAPAEAAAAAIRPASEPVEAAPASAPPDADRTTPQPAIASPVAPETKEH